MAFLFSLRLPSLQEPSGFQHYALQFAVPVFFTNDNDDDEDDNNNDENDNNNNDENDNNIN